MEEQSGAFLICNIRVNKLSSVSIVNACKFQRQNVILEVISAFAVVAAGYHIAKMVNTL